MSPSSAVARPVWVFSLPAVAILISLLWLRKKRGSLQTDTGGGPGEPVNVSDKVALLQDPPETVVLDSECVCAPENNNVIEDTKAETTVDSCPVTAQEEATTQAPQPVAAEVAVAEDLENQESVAISNNQLNVVEMVEEFVCEPVLVEPVETASLSEIGQKAVDQPMREEKVTVMNHSPAGKWGKKKHKGKKVSLTAMHKMTKSEEQKDVSLEQKLAKLDIGGQVAEEEKEQKCVEKLSTVNGERDSANTSPSEVMLASPSLSGYSDTHSEGSSDSGKGCSDVPTPVSGNSLSGDIPPAIVLYDFLIPQKLVGRLIGRNGNYIQEIKENTHAAVFIKPYHESNHYRVCGIEGTQSDIDNALDMIRHKFPLKRFPHLTLEPIEPQPEAQPMLSENLLLYLVEGVNNDVIISSLISAGHLFLQQPTHPTYPSLSRLTACMASCYAEPNQPPLPDIVKVGTVCAAPVQAGWFRAQIIELLDGDFCKIQFVDYGGYMTVEKSQLRQIRSDFVALPFQAAECFLAAIQPSGSDEWNPEARAVVESLTYGRVLQAQVHGYSETGVPFIFLYTFQENEFVLVNEELVARGFAEWVATEPVTEEVDFYTEPSQQSVAV